MIVFLDGRHSHMKVFLITHVRSVLLGAKGPISTSRKILLGQGSSNRRPIAGHPK